MSDIARWLDNLASIEISTEIVDEICDEVFIPWEAYRAIYEISRPFLENSGISLSLCDRFLELRRQLELAYALLLIDPSSRLYNRAAVKAVKQQLSILTSKNTRDWEHIPTRLPDPASITKINRLLSDRRFLQTLHQLYRAKLQLERRQRNSASEIASIYARTTIQLDGEIANCYDRAIFECRDRENLLKLHQRSVSAGQKQWRELLNFVASLY